MIARGQAEGLFRKDVDPVEIHKAIAALGMFNVTNQYTFGAIFQRDMGAKGDVAPAPRHGRRLDSQLPDTGGGKHEIQVNRRTALKAGAALAASRSASRLGAGQADLRFAAVFSDKDIRADMIRMLAKDVAGRLHDRAVPTTGSLFKQGTELVALQRDNLELGNIAPQDISKQIPAWSILTSAYLFRDANHLFNFWSSDLGAQYKKQAEEQVKIKILGPTFFGTRQVGLKPKKKINTPADMAGIKLRMPPGDAWQLLGRSLGANPTPMAFAETYTGLQTGAVDGQDNPLPNVNAMKFYEVMSQIVLTSHLIGYDLLCMNLKLWNSLPAAKQKSFQAAVDKALDVEHGRAPEARGGAGRQLQEARASRSTRRTSTPSARTRRRSTSPPTRRRSGRRGCSRRSTR